SFRNLVQNRPIAARPLLVFRQAPGFLSFGLVPAVFKALAHIRTNSLNTRAKSRRKHRVGEYEDSPQSGSGSCAEYKRHDSREDPPGAAQINLIHLFTLGGLSGFVPFAALNLVHANGANRSQDAMLQPPGDQILHRVVDLIPGEKPDSPRIR